MRIKNIDDIVISACQLWPKCDFNADLYLFQRKIWRDKKNINMTMNRPISRYRRHYGSKVNRSKKRKQDVIAFCMHT